MQILAKLKFVNISGSSFFPHDLESFADTVPFPNYLFDLFILRHKDT